MRILSLIILISAFFVPCKGQQISLNLLHNWHNPYITGSFAYQNAYNEVWGYAENGKEYAIIGSTRGTHIHDVTDPLNAYEAVFIQGRDTGAQIIHRDFKTYLHYLYSVADEGVGSLQISDLSFLPDSAPVRYDSSLFSKSHNIFIDTATARLYVCGGPFFLKIYSLANPLNPTLLLNCNSSTVPFWSQIGGIHDLYVQNDTAYLHAGPDGMHIVSFANINTPSLLGSINFYPDKGYNHSGWIDNENKMYYFADENHGYKIKGFDISDFSNITLRDTFWSGVTSNSIPHNLFVKGNKLYTSYYYDGLVVFDISNPQAVTIAGSYDTYPQDNFSSYKGAWGVYPYLPSGNILVSDMQTGLYVFGETIMSIQDEKEDKIKMFPNPATSVLHVESVAERTFQVVISDITGKKLLESYLNGSGTMDVSTLPVGIYLVQFPGSSMNSQKLIISSF